MAAQATAESAESIANTLGVTAELARRAADLKFTDLPDEVIELARQCLLDGLGVTLAGSREPLVEILAAEAEEQGGNPQATLIGRGVKTSTLQAALVNGSAAHALDYDDVNQSITGHPTVTVYPGLLALAESRGASGAEFITAFVAGYETACRVGAMVNPGHYERGFHATATLGSFGSAAACARLMGLNAEHTAAALGIAATQAAGLKAMFGTMCKPLHAGKAAHSGLLAAKLAARGFTSAPDAIEHRQGFAAALGSDCRPEAALADPPGGFHIRDNLFKYHAACYLTHAPIECASRLRDEHSIRPEQIESVIVRVGEGLDTVCNIPEPETGLEAKFSLRLTTALALAGRDTSSIATYTDGLCAEPALVALRDRVTVELVEGWSRTYAELSITLAEGGRVETKHDSGIPAKDLPAQREQLEAKFRALAGPLAGAERTELLVQENVDLAELLSLSESRIVH